MAGARLFLALWLTLCCALAQADVVRVRAFDDIIESGVLKVAMYENFPPYSYQQDGQPRGVDFELAQKLAEGLGLKLEVLWVTPDETLDDDLRNFIWKGHYLRRDVLADVMLRVPYDREFSYKRNELGELINELVVMFGPYQRERWQTAYDDRRIEDVPSVAVFQYHPIGVEVDSVPSFYLSSVFEGRLAKNLHHYPSVQQAFAALKEGEVDATMAMRGEIEWLMAQAGDSHLKLAENAYPNMGKQVWDLGMAVHESNRQLAYALEEVLEPLILEGGMEKLYAKHGLHYELPGLYQDVENDVAGR
ncbi:Cyclohexadienyl dehydratase precursor [Streptococcus pneumoniae]|jgi:ABC-type amino acid transport substrate-binding protein|uniref:Periplasmic binding protein, putative n=3 Tax=Stutzerimonas stutzeri TaxID=316 RepID=A4VLS7_STUS1|nr:transporter substrate-binding domain-containing protein [Stutzerimonas stutzeri]MBA4689738.1 transporter substrate-binding domain-containing protein [Pseudomonas sp.]MCJ0879465.1 transporter substrate-binding domain-containing protein [Pseudomonas sp. JI-2]NMY65174.1 amino acid ABC transporter substrate-binding protein [Pseudomonas sp. WS 5018]CJK84907.1 Cyclohexadienyl dehydratase precursor [Streptococcus pneumoniae]ABP79928.1 periplasmic binding protein, putative [Stutzerimonas stutzeri A